MARLKLNPDTISTYKVIKKIRNDWGNINPVTTAIPNKKHDYEYPDSYYDYDSVVEDTINLNEQSDW